MEISLLICVLILMTCIFLSKLTHRLGLPTLLFFILLGMVFGSDGFFKISFTNYSLTEQLCTIALIFIIFYGGFGTSWKAARPVVKPALILSTLGVLLTALLTGFFCFFFLKMKGLESLLMGAIISSTDAASVFSILRSKKLNLKEGTASILELESGSNDPMAYMLTTLCIGLMNQTALMSDVPLLLLTQLGIGAFLGTVIGLLSAHVLKRVNFMIDGFETIFVLSIALLSYSLPTILGGNGYLATYLCGIIIGNSQIPNKVILVNFFDGLTGLAQILSFFLLGLLAFPSKIPTIFVPALLIFFWLTFLARPLTVFLLMLPFKTSWQQKVLLSWSGLRGATSIVFAILTFLGGQPLTYDIFHISFCICLISVALQGTLLPAVAKKLAMIDRHANAFRTFTDYQEEAHLPLLKITITPKHHWANRLIRDLKITDTLILMIRRKDQTLIPDGDTKLLPGDQLVVSGTHFQEYTNLPLTEIQIDNSHPWVHKQIKHLDLPHKTLVILIKRQDGTNITPKGDTRIENGDTLVLTAEHFHQGIISCM